jgi:TP901 family phage tail tape measure protein
VVSNSGINLVGNVDLNAGGAIRAATALSQRFKSLSENSRTSSKTLKDTAQAMNAAAGAADKERRSLSALATAQARVNKLNRESLATAAKLRAQAGAVNSGAADKSLVAGGQAQLLENRALSETIKQRIALEDAAGRASIRGAQLGSIATRDRIAQEKLLIAQERLRMQQEAATARAANTGRLGLSAAANAMSGASSAIGHFSSLGAVAVGVIESIGINAEHSFAQVLRTTGALETAHPERTIAVLKQQFDSLANSLPISYTELTKIGAAAGQLGIRAQDVGSFTSTVAKFAATSNVSTEQAATAFGRLDTILPDVNHNYQGLADSILNVGVKSVATESQIIGIATQLSSVANQAGFSSKELIGLSGALASVGAAPELSRGTFTRLFSQIQTATSEGGDSLQKFASISGQTTAEFKASWDPNTGDAGSAFVRFMDGLRKSGAKGNQELMALGINSVRDRPLLLRLANAMVTTGTNADGTARKVALLNKLMGDASEEKALGTLNKQYAILSNTTAARLQVLLNNVETTLRVISQSNFGPLNSSIDGLVRMFQDLNVSLNQNVKLFGLIELPIKNSEIVGFGVLLAGIVSVLGLAAAGVLRLGSGMLNMVRLFTEGKAKMLEFRASVLQTTTALAEQTAVAAANGRAGTFVASTQGVIGRAATSSAGKMGILKNALSGVGSSVLSLGKAFIGLAALTAILELPAFIDNLGKTSSNLDLLAAKLDHATTSGKAFSAAVLNVQRSNVNGLVPDPGKVFGNIDSLKKALDQGPALSGFQKFVAQLGAGAGTASGGGSVKLVRDIQDMSTETEALNESLNKVGQNKGFDTVGKGLANFADEAKLTNKQLTNLIDSMPDVKRGLQVALANTGKGTSDKDILKYVHSLNQMPPAAKAAAAAQADLKTALEGSGVSADEFSSAISNAYSSAVDFGTIYQKTLDAVNNKAKQKWVAAGNDVSKFTDTAKASFKDFAATADKAISTAQRQQANVATIAQGLGDAKYVPQLEKLAPAILQQVVSGMSKGGTQGLVRLKGILDKANMGPEIAQQIATAIDDPKIIYGFTTLGGKAGQDFSDALTTSLGNGTGVTGALDIQFEKTYQKLRSTMDSGKPVKIPAELEDAPVRAKFADMRTFLEAQVLYAQVHGNTDEATKKYGELQDYIKNHPATMTIDADSSPVRKKGEDDYQYLSRLIPIMRIEGYDVPFRKKGESAKAYADRLVATMNIAGDNKRAKDSADAAKNYADGKTGKINIIADTAAAVAEINALTAARSVPIFFKVQNTPGSTPPFKNRAGGGIVRGPGTSYSDSINAKLSDGEFVVRAAQAKKNLSLLYAINNGIQGFATGGQYTGGSAHYEGTQAAVASAHRASNSHAVQQVELSPYDRHLLQTVADRVGVTITPDHIAGATNSTYRAQSRRGNG